MTEQQVTDAVDTAEAVTNGEVVVGQTPSDLSFPDPTDGAPAIATNPENATPPAPPAPENAAPPAPENPAPPAPEVAPPAPENVAPPAPEVAPPAPEVAAPPAPENAAPPAPPKLSVDESVQVAPMTEQQATDAVDTADAVTNGEVVVGQTPADLSFPDPTVTDGVPAIATNPENATPPAPENAAPPAPENAAPPAPENAAPPAPENAAPPAPENVAPPAPELSVDESVRVAPMTERQVTEAVDTADAVTTGEVVVGETPAELTFPDPTVTDSAPIVATDSENVTPPAPENAAPPAADDVRPAAAPVLSVDESVRVAPMTEQQVTDAVDTADAITTGEVVVGETPTGLTFPDPTGGAPESPAGAEDRSGSSADGVLYADARAGNVVSDETPPTTGSLLDQQESATADRDGTAAPGSSSEGGVRLSPMTDEQITEAVDRAEQVTGGEFGTIGTSSITVDPTSSPDSPTFTISDSSGIVDTSAPLGDTADAVPLPRPIEEPPASRDGSGEVAVTPYQPTGGEADLGEAIRNGDVTFSTTGAATDGSPGPTGTATDESPAPTGSGSAASLGSDISVGVERSADGSLILPVGGTAPQELDLSAERTPPPDTNARYAVGNYAGTPDANIGTYYNTGNGSETTAVTSGTLTEGPFQLTGGLQVDDPNPPAAATGEPSDAGGTLFATGSLGDRVNREAGVSFNVTGAQSLPGTNQAATRTGTLSAGVNGQIGDPQTYPNARLGVNYGTTDFQGVPLPQQLGGGTAEVDRLTASGQLNLSPNWNVRYDRTQQVDNNFGGANPEDNRFSVNFTQEFGGPGDGDSGSDRFDPANPAVEDIRTDAGTPATGRPGTTGGQQDVTFGTTPLSEDLFRYDPEAEPTFTGGGSDASFQVPGASGAPAPADTGDDLDLRSSTDPGILVARSEPGGVSDTPTGILPARDTTDGDTGDTRVAQGSPMSPDAGGRQFPPASPQPESQDPATFGNPSANWPDQPVADPTMRFGFAESGRWAPVSEYVPLWSTQFAPINANAEQLFGYSNALRGVRIGEFNNQQGQAALYDRRVLLQQGVDQNERSTRQNETNAAGQRVINEATNQLNQSVSGYNSAAGMNTGNQITDGNNANAADQAALTRRNNVALYIENGTTDQYTTELQRILERLPADSTDPRTTQGQEGQAAYRDLVLLQTQGLPPREVYERVVAAHPSVLEDRSGAAPTTLSEPPATVSVFEPQDVYGRAESGQVTDPEGFVEQRLAQLPTPPTTPRYPADRQAVTDAENQVRATPDAVTYRPDQVATEFTPQRVAPFNYRSNASIQDEGRYQTELLTGLAGLSTATSPLRAPVAPYVASPLEAGFNTLYDNRIDQFANEILPRQSVNDVEAASQSAQSLGLLNQQIVSNDQQNLRSLQSGAGISQAAFDQQRRLAIEGAAYNLATAERERLNARQTNATTQQFSNELNETGRSDARALTDLGNAAPAADNMVRVLASNAAYLPEEQREVVFAGIRGTNGFDRPSQLAALRQLLGEENFDAIVTMQTPLTGAATPQLLMETPTSRQQAAEQSAATLRDPADTDEIHVFGDGKVGVPSWVLGPGRPRQVLTRQDAEDAAYRYNRANDLQPGDPGYVRIPAGN